MSADRSTKDGLNRYAYARNNPLRYTDPTGLGAKEDLEALAAAFASWKLWGGSLGQFLKALEFAQNLDAIRSGLIEVTGRPLQRHPELATDAVKYGYRSFDRMIADAITNGKLLYDTETGHYMYVKAMQDGTVARVTFDPNPAGQGIKVFSAETGMKETRVVNKGASGRWKRWTENTILGKAVLHRP